MNSNNIKDIFKDFEKAPSVKVWENIDKKISSPEITKGKSLFKNPKFYLPVGISFVMIIMLLYLNFQNNENTINNNSEFKIIKNNNFTIPSETKMAKKPLKSNIDKNINDLKITSQPNKSITISPSVANFNQNINNHENKSTDAYIPKSNENSLVTKVLNDKNSVTEVTKDNNINNPVIPDNPALQKINNTSNIIFSTDQTICKGDKVKLTVEGAKTCLWSTGEKTLAIYVSPEVTTDFSILATDDYGNQKAGIITVTVANCELLFVPNAFTPNGDGQHDIFKPVGFGIRNYEIIIFSRNGQIVYNSRNFEDGWDGNVNGVPAPLGTYVYNIKYLDDLNKQHNLNGHVNLIR